MPYYQRAWNAIADKDKKPAVASKKLRFTPVSEPPPSEDEINFQRQPHPDIKAVQVNFMRGLLKKQVTLLSNSIEAAQPTSKHEEKFSNYKINYKKDFFKGQFSAMYEAFNYKFTDNVLICRVFEPAALIDPVKDVYLKILRQIGKKHPCLISTWDIFYDKDNRIFLFQEFANLGNGQDFMRKERPLEEGQVLRWAQSIYRGLEFLGDIGIAHRSIHPKHVLIKVLVGASDVQVKLSGFRSAIIYWDAQTDDIIDQPCRPLAQKNYTNFQAPEVFGNEGEFYNPIDADIWSFGAVMFTLVTRVYPYNILAPGGAVNIDEEIKATIDSTTTLSAPAKEWFYGLMRANVKRRFDFDEIKRHPWFKGAGSATPLPVISNAPTTTKHQGGKVTFGEAGEGGKIPCDEESQPIALPISPPQPPEEPSETTSSSASQAFVDTAKADNTVANQ